MNYKHSHEPWTPEKYDSSLSCDVGSNQKEKKYTSNHKGQNTLSVADVLKHKVHIVDEMRQIPPVCVFD